jgi:hypothetical protein
VSPSELTNFQWSNPLEALTQKYMNNPAVMSADGAYLMYLEFLIVIWVRLINDFQTHDYIHGVVKEKIYSILGKHTLSSEERHILGLNDAAKLSLQVDYESFLIFACILMDKIPRLAQALLVEDPNIPTKSFHKHKEYFMKPDNTPYDLNENYAKLIREQTDWFDISLELARDKLVTHGATSGIGIKRDKKQV